jgi:hypothetical protein
MEMQRREQLVRHRRMGKTQEVKIEVVPKVSRILPAEKEKVFYF